MTSDDFAEAACCIWEEFLNLKNFPRENLADFPHIAKIQQDFEDLGTSAMRMKAINLAEDCHHDWVEAVIAGYEDCFDWDFVPEWIKENY